MTDDWHPGDLAWCVRHDRSPPRGLLRVGALYRAVLFGIDAAGQPCVGLRLHGVDAPKPYTGFAACLFRKVGRHRETGRLIASVRLPSPVR